MSRHTTDSADDGVDGTIGRKRETVLGANDARLPLQDVSDGLLDEGPIGDRVDASMDDTTVAVDTPSRPVDCVVRRRKGLLSVIGLLCGLLLMLGVASGYLDADALAKCGECVRSLSAASTALQNDTYGVDAFTTRLD